MNRRLYGWLCVMGCGLLIGCGGVVGSKEGGKTPSEVVKRYLVAVASGDTETAVNCMNPEDRATLRAIIEARTSIVVARIQKEGGLESITILNETISENSAWVTFQVKTKNGPPWIEDKNPAKKINGVWYTRP